MKSISVAAFSHTMKVGTPFSVFITARLDDRLGSKEQVTVTIWVCWADLHPVVELVTISDTEKSFVDDDSPVASNLCEGLASEEVDASPKAHA